MQNQFDERKRLKSYQTNINLEHLYANDHKNLMEMLVVFFVQIFKKDGTFYPLEVCM